MLKLNPVVQSLLGGLAAAIVVAGPIVDNGVLPSEALSILGAFLAGSGLAALPSAAQRREAAAAVEEVDGKHKA